MSQATEHIAAQYALAHKIKQVWSDIVINVKVFGAKGDGTTDDTSAIQTAINYAISVGKKEVTFPVGTYKYGVLTNTDGITFIGDGVTLDGTTPMDLVSLSSLASGSSELVINVLDYGAKGDGVTDNSVAVQNAIDAVVSTGNGVVFFPAGTYKLTKKFDVDVSKVSLMGFGAVLDCSALVAGNNYCFKLYSTTDYNNMFKNVRPAFTGFQLLGGSSTSPVTYSGLLIGDATNANSSMYSIRDVQVQGFTKNVEFTHNAWKVHFLNFNSRWGKISAPAGLGNMGENITFINCFINDGDGLADVEIGNGEFHFIGVSFDNVTLRANGDCTIFVTDSHFENPGNASGGYRMISIEHDEADVYVSNSYIVLNDPGTLDFTKALFYVQDTNTKKGLVIKNIRFFQAGYYTPWVNDVDALFVAGKGRAICDGMTSNMNFNGIVFSQSMNKIYNGDGETGDNKGWTVTGTGSLSNDTTTFKAGTKSLKMSAASTQTLTTSQKFNLSPGKWLLGQLWWKTSFGTGGSCNLKISFMADDDTEILTLGYTSVNTAFDWTLYRAFTDIIPKGAKYGKIEFFLIGGTAGTSNVWFDEFIVNEV